jgi:hypothetical protein
MRAGPKAGGKQRVGGGGRKRKPPAVPASTPAPAGEMDTETKFEPLAYRSPEEAAALVAADEVLPVRDESMLKLPDAPVGVPGMGAGVRRRRRRKAQETEDDVGIDDMEGALDSAGTHDVVGEGGAAAKAAAVVDGFMSRRSSKGLKGMKQDADEKAEDEQAAIDAVRRLTTEFRNGSADAADTILRSIEIDPDFLFSTGNATGEYDTIAALIGTGAPNKQGLYVLPYLQSGHILLLTVVLLCAFVYYPGFPLTELEEEVREKLKLGLSLTYIFNAVLAVFAFREAKKRGQPGSFWAGKTAFLGGLAFQELRANVLTEEERKAVVSDRKKRRGKKGGSK